MKFSKANALKLTGLFLSAIGILGVLVSITAIIDPVGTKLADDGDPFGIPPSLSETIIVTGIYFLVVVVGG
ncbi:MAG: hypothetical protein AAF387_17820, partial [Pseudomonadota bacterium]